MSAAARLAAVGLLRPTGAGVGDEPPAWLVDQLVAACRGGQGGVAVAVGRLRRPAKVWHPEGFPVGWEALVGPAVLACRPCWHLRHRPVQPAFARLAVGRLDCGRCARTVVRDPAPWNCDLCGAGSVVFHERLWRVGPLIAHANACPACHAACGGDP
jgi:hypothetical protein